MRAERRRGVAALAAVLAVAGGCAESPDEAPRGGATPDAGVEDGGAGLRDGGAVDAGPFESDGGAQATDGGAAPGDAGVGPRDGGSTGAAPLDLNDVSLLLPLPVAGEPRAAFSWLTPEAGEVGPYFPVHRRDELPAPIADFPLEPGDAEMVVGIRFDPCFRDTARDPCQPQLRLVAQPVLYAGSQAPQLLDDTAVHLFYALSTPETEAVVGALSDIAARSPVDTRGPLRVHPGLAAAGTDGPLGAAVQALVVDHCRADNLIRITTNTFAFDNWSFQRFEWRDDHLAPQPLVGLTSPSHSQAWLRQAFTDDLDDPSGTITPAPVESFAHLLAPASYDTPDPAEVEPAVALLTRIENPRARLTGEVDCVSCHVGAQLRLYAERRGIDFSSAPDPYTPPPGVDTTLHIAPEVDGNLGVTIMFGYHHQHDGRILPSISRRVVFETAEVVQALRAP